MFVCISRFLGIIRFELAIYLQSSMDLRIQSSHTESSKEKLNLVPHGKRSIILGLMFMRRTDTNLWYARHDNNKKSLGMEAPLPHVMQNIQVVQNSHSFEGTEHPSLGNMFYLCLGLYFHDLIIRDPSQPLIAPRHSTIISLLKYDTFIQNVEQENFH